MKNETYIDTISNEKLKREIYYFENGNIWIEKYFLDDHFHRIDGPAVINHYNNGEISMECYHLNGSSHRIDGPADIYYYKNGDIKREYYYLNGKVITELSQIKEINGKSIQKDLIQKEEFENKNIKQTKTRRIFIID